MEDFVLPKCCRAAARAMLMPRSRSFDYEHSQEVEAVFVVEALFVFNFHCSFRRFSGLIGPKFHVRGGSLRVLGINFHRCGPKFHVRGGSLQAEILCEREERNVSATLGICSRVLSISSPFSLLIEESFMASYSPVEVDLEKQRRDSRNYRRRLAYCEKSKVKDVPALQLANRQCEEILKETEKQVEQLLLDAEVKGAQLIIAAKQQCHDLQIAAKNVADVITANARNQASVLLANIHESTTTLCALRSEIGREKAHLRELSAAAACGIVQPETVEIEEETNLQTSRDDRLRKDAARKRDAYRLKKRPRAAAEGIDIGECPDDGEDILPNRKRRAIANVVSEVVSNFLSRMKNWNSTSKKLALDRFWLHSELRKWQPAALGCPKLDASIGTAVADLKKTLQIVKWAKRKDHLANKHALFAALVGQSTVQRRNLTSLSRALGVKRDNLRKAKITRKGLDDDKSKRYPMGERKVRSDKTSAYVRKIVESYWETHTRISPNKKDSARLRLGRKEYEDHRIHWLEETEVEFYFSFIEWCKREANGACVGLRIFQRLKPYYIRTMKDRNVCCCKHHVEMDLLKEAINKFSRHEHSNECSCGCETCRPPGSCEQGCVMKKTMITSVRAWIEGALCVKQLGQQWHLKKCLMGLCENCGVEKLKWCPTDLDPSHNRLVDWQTFQYVRLDDTAETKRQKKKGSDESASKKITRLRMVFKQSSMADFKMNVLSVTKDFIVHNFRARWQADQHKLCMKTFPRGTIVSSIDFSENYTFKFQNEVQTQHWDNKQVTLLILVTYRHREDVTGVEAAVGRSVQHAQNDEGDRDIVADYHFYISDDNTHDTLFVQHYMDAHWRWMKEEGIEFDQHWVWSDGCAAQFKACRPFYYVSRYYKRFGARMKWYFHASGHGKGVADGLGGHIKSGIEKEQLKGIHGHRLENAHDVVEFCKDKFAFGQEREYGDVQLVRRIFWEIGAEEVNRKKKWACDPIKGSRDLHCFDGFSPSLSTLLLVRDLACFCGHCVDDQPNCANLEWVGKFRLEMVKGVLQSDVKADLESFGVGESRADKEHGALAELVQLGDFYAVQASQPNEWNVDYYVCQCEQTLHEVKESFEDGYKEKFEKGELVLQGRWFEPHPRNEFKFVFNDKRPSCYSHAETVVHIRFPLMPCNESRGQKGGTRMYSLDTDTVAAISASLSL